MVSSSESQAESFDRGVVAHIGLVRHIGAATLSGHYDLDDFTQDVLARAFAKRDQLRDPSRLRAWLASIARNTARNWNRNRRFAFAELSDALSLPVQPADEWLSERERWAALVDALSRLPESDQALIRAYYYDEVSAREIEAQAQLSAGAVRVRLSRARAVLRERLTPLLGVLGVIDGARAPRGFGEVPRGSNRMGMMGSLACSLAVVGWLGFGAYQVEEAVWNAATPVRYGHTLSPIGLLKVDLGPRVDLVVAQGAEGAAPLPVSGTEEEQSVGKELDVAPTRTISTVVATLHALLQETDPSAWSMDRLYGVLGHAFTFEMKEGGDDVWQEAQLDYGRGSGFFEMLPELGHGVTIFDTAQSDEEGGFDDIVADAWDAVRASVDRGIPALVWQPMTLEMKDEGIRAGAWGMLIGYDESDETYAVRHQYIGLGQETYPVRYDGLGTVASANWFCVLVFDRPEESVEVPETHLRALRNAVAFAENTRWAPATGHHRGDARGLAAYPLWREAFESGEAEPEYSQYHAHDLQVFRGHAAAYLRELVEVFPAAASTLQEAAEHYDRLVEIATTLHDLCAAARDEGRLSDDARVEAARLVTAALDADRSAIARIAAALATLEESQ